MHYLTSCFIIITSSIPRNNHTKARHFFYPDFQASFFSSGKVGKINEELKTLAGIVDAELKKADAAPAPAKAVPVKSAPAKTTVAPKKRGRPAKK